MRVFKNIFFLNCFSSISDQGTAGSPTLGSFFVSPVMEMQPENMVNNQLYRLLLLCLLLTAHPFCSLLFLHLVCRLWKNAV